LNPNDAQLVFAVPNVTLFREPTVLARPNIPLGSSLGMLAPTQISQYNLIRNSAGMSSWVGAAGGAGGFLSDVPNPLDIQPSGVAPAGTQRYIGICVGLFPIDWLGNPRSSGTAGIYESNNLGLVSNYGPAPYITYRLQYKDPNPSDVENGWVTYDEKYCFLDTLFLSSALRTTSGNLSDQADGAPGGDWESYADPRTSRFGAVNGWDLESPVQTPGGSGATGEWADPTNDIEVTDRPDVNSGYAISDNRYTNDGEFYSIVASGWMIGQYYFRNGLLSQNNPAVQDNGIRFSGDPANSTPGEGPTYYADPDGVVRGAMGYYVTGGGSAPASTTVGLPLATAYPFAQNPIGYPITVTGPYQGQSRPYFLHRPFRSVAELGYVFSGTPWKNIDFFTPQSGDASLLDVFTINEPPSETTDPNELVAGVVNLNTRQAPVMQAILAGASVDEAFTSGAAQTGFYPFGILSANQTFSQAQWASILTPRHTTENTVLSNIAGNIAGYAILDTVPLTNVSELVGRWVTATGVSSGFVGDLSNLYSTAYKSNGETAVQTMQNVDRFRESFIRPLATVGDTRVWNLMIDIIAQTGQYQPGAATLDNFTVSTQRRYWLHEAIDRYTGQVLDQNLEPVGPTTLSLTGTSVTDNLPVGAAVASLGSSELLAGGTFSYSLVSGSGGTDNASFTVSGNVLQTAAVFDYLAQSTYNILLNVTDQSGFTYQQPVTINVQPGPYTQWKMANFGASAGDPTVAGDLVDSQNDGMPNLMKYALGKSPVAPSTTGITIQNIGGMLTMNYTVASAATDVTVTASCTSNLNDPTSWTTTGVTQTMLSDNGTIQQWQATVPESSASTLFMHLTVTKP